MVFFLNKIFSLNCVKSCSLSCFGFGHCYLSDAWFCYWTGTKSCLDNHGGRVGFLQQSFLSVDATKKDTCQI